MNMQKMLKQAQKMQDKLQRELAEVSVETTVGGGMVGVKMNGNKQLLAIKIEPDALDPDDAGMLEDLIVAAVNEASRKVDEDMQGKVGSMMPNVPGLF